MLTIKEVSEMVNNYLHYIPNSDILSDELVVEYFDCNPDQGVVLRLPEDSEEDAIDLFDDLLSHLDGLEYKETTVVVDTGLSNFDVAIYLKDS